MNRDKKEYRYFGETNLDGQASGKGIAINKEYTIEGTFIDGEQMGVMIRRSTDMSACC